MLWQTGRRTEEKIEFVIYSMGNEVNKPGSTRQVKLTNAKTTVIVRSSKRGSTNLDSYSERYEDMEIQL